MNNNGELNRSEPDNPIRVGKNLLANYFGQAWSAIMSLVFIPLYIQLLGIEAYGLVGFYIVVQMMLSVFDLGITPTLSREMARYKAGSLKEQSINSLLSTLEICTFAIASLIFVSFGSMSDLIASKWISAELLSQSTVSDALVLMGLAISVRFIEAIYKGSLIGLEEQVWFNVVNAGIATLRFGGVVIVLTIYSNSIETFFYWQALVSLIALLIFRHKTLLCLTPEIGYKKFDVNVINKVWKFASGMLSISFLSLLLTQTDKIILSNLLPLKDFSYYTLAVTIAGSLYMLITPITQAFYPRMVYLVAVGDNRALNGVFHQATQLVNVLILPIVLTISLFSDVIIYAWTGNEELTNNAAPILSIYIIGSYFNGLVNIPYHLQLAYGWASLAVKMNLVTVIFLVPLIIWLTPIFGSMGASYAWVFINMIYFVIGSLLMFRRLLPEARTRWFLVDIGFPSFLMTGIAVLIFLAVDIDRSQRLLSLLSIFEVIIGLVATGVISSIEVRNLLGKLKRKF